MTVCNMTIEGGGRAGMIAPDETTFEWVIGRAGAPVGGPRRVARAPYRRGGGVRQADRRRRVRDQPDGHLGDEPRDGRAGHWRGARAAHRSGRARARVHGARARNADRRDQARPRVHRLVHELADRGPARGRRRRQGPQGRRQRVRDGRPRLPAGQGAGRAGRARRGLPARRVRLARGRAARCASG